MAWGWTGPLATRRCGPITSARSPNWGVAGDAADQRIPGADPAKTYGDYRFPMQPISRSFADQSTSPAIKAAKLDPKKFPHAMYPAALDAVTMPQARNSLPNPDYVNPETDARGYQPVLGADDPTSGLRSEGNSKCVPICPVQAKYNALKSLRAAQKSGRVTVLTQTVATEVLWDKGNSRITGIVTKSYSDFPDFNMQTRTLRARAYVLASHTVESTKLLLNSGVPNTSDQLGRNLMDNVNGPQASFVTAAGSPNFQQRVPAFVTVNLYVEVRNRSQNISGYVRINNLLDNYYYGAGSGTGATFFRSPQDTRWVQAGLKVMF